MTIKFKEDVEIDEEKGIIYAVDGIVKDLYGKVILIQSKKEYFKGLWLLPGGKRKGGEPPHVAVIREVKEEVGYDVKTVRYVGRFSKKGRDKRFYPDFEVVSDCYVVEPIGDAKTTPDEEEIKRWEWFTPDQIRSMRDIIGLDHYDMLEKAGIV